MLRVNFPERYANDQQDVIYSTYFGNKSPCLLLPQTHYRKLKWERKVSLWLKKKTTIITAGNLDKRLCSTSVHAVVVLVHHFTPNFFFTYFNGVGLQHKSCKSCRPIFVEKHLFWAFCVHKTYLLRVRKHVFFSGKGEL